MISECVGQRRLKHNLLNRNHIVANMIELINHLSQLIVATSQNKNQYTIFKAPGMSQWWCSDHPVVFKT